VKTPRTRLGAVLTLLGLFLSCEGHNNPGGFLRQETEELQRRTVPPGSEALVRSGPTQEGWTKIERWEFETSWDWSKYQAWVTSDLQPDFGVQHVGESHLRFVRHLTGDAEKVDIGATSNGVRLHIKVTLTTYPD